MFLSEFNILNFLNTTEGLHLFFISSSTVVSPLHALSYYFSGQPCEVNIIFNMHESITRLSFVVCYTTTEFDVTPKLKRVILLCFRTFVNILPFYIATSILRR